MGYKLNTQAYEFFIRIEVGIREFLIELIQKKGVQEWFYGFLGSVQRDNLNEVSKRINEANKRQQIPNVEDVFVFKLSRAKKDSEMSFFSTQLFHPFYYLNWSDMENLMRMKINTDLIDQTIGKLNREVVVGNLVLLSFLRNDVAHSRFISENDLKIVKSSYDQISAVIPSFETYINAQTKEDKLNKLLEELITKIRLIQERDLLEMSAIDEVLICMNKCVNSFWLRSTNNVFITDVNKLYDEMKIYGNLRKMPGGLLKIYKWRRTNSELLNNLATAIDNGKI